MLAPLQQATSLLPGEIFRNMAYLRDLLINRVFFMFLGKATTFSYLVLYLLDRTLSEGGILGTSYWLDETIHWLPQQLCTCSHYAISLTK